MRQPTRTYPRMVLGLSLLCAGVCPARIGLAAKPAGKPAPASATAASLRPAPSGESVLSREAVGLLLHGDAEAVVRLFTEAAGLRTEAKTPVDAVAWGPLEAAVLGEAYTALGQHGQARRVLEPHVAAKAKAPPEVILALAEVERQAGSSPARRKLLTEAVRHHPKHPGLLVALGEALLEAGQAVLARKLLDPLADRFEAGEFKEPVELVAAAQSLALNGYVRDANRVFEQAAEVAAEPQERIAAELPWGELFVSRYNYRDGDKSFRAVLAVNPKHARALVGMARIDLASDQDVGKARKRLDDLLQRNPRELDALVLRADVALHDEDFATARALLTRAHSQRPDHPATLHAQAALCRLQDDNGCFAEAEKAALKINKDDGRFYLVVAQWLEQAHRYREVMDLLRVAIEKDGSLWQAHAALGLAYARLADDTKARKHLETAYAGDPFDVRTANQLSVLYDGALAQMVLLPGRAVDLRVHRRDRKAFERTMLPFLQDSHDLLAKKYGFAAARPLQVEIFPESEQFSVRTVGLPRLGAHAVCFGHLITSRSPSEAPFNWKMVLHHEMAHVFHIQASDGRVPRWLTEGLAMMESAWADPRWRMHMDRRAWDRLQAGELAEVARFNLAFTQARTMQDIMDAYYQAMLLVQFLNERHGFDKLRALVAGYKSGKPTAVLVQQHFGVAPAAIDKEFAVWLGKSLVRYEKDFRPSPQSEARRLGLTLASGPAPEPSAGDDEEAALVLPLAPAATPTSAQPLRPLLAEVIQHLHHGRTAQAEPLLRQAIAQADKPGTKVTEAERKDLCTLRFWLMQRAIAAGDKALARTQAQSLVAEPAARCDGVSQRQILALLHKAAGEIGPAVVHLRAAAALDPGDGSLDGLLHELVGKAARELWGEAPGRVHLQAFGIEAATQASKGAGILREVQRALVQAEPNRPEPAALLAQLAWREHKANPAAKVGDDLDLAARALEEADPGGWLAPLAEARAAVVRGKAKMALVPYRLAAERAGSAAERADAWCELAAAAVAAGDKEEAAAAQRRCAKP